MQCGSNKSAAYSPKREYNLKDKNKNNKDATPARPKGSTTMVFARLFRQYAMRHSFRLFIGIIAGIIMGGAMHAFLSFVDMGITTIDAGVSQSQEVQEKTQQGVMEKLSKYRAVQWTLDKLDVKLEKDKTVPDAADSPKSSKHNDLITGKLDGILKNFGLNTDSSQSLSLPLVCVLIAGIIIFFALKAFGEFTNKYCLRWIGSKVVTDLREDIFNNLQKQSLAFYSRHDVGQILSRCTYDAGTIEHAFANCISEMFTSPMQILVAVIFLIQKACASNLVRPTVILIIAMPVFIIPIYVISKIIREYQHKVLGRVSVLVTRMQENISGIRVVKSFNMEEFETKRFAKDSRKYFKTVSKAILADIFMTPVMQITAIAIGAGFILLCLHYKISLSTVAVLGYAAQNAYKPIKELSKMNSNMQKCAAAAERIFETLDVKDVIPEIESPVTLDGFHDRISFNNVTFSYDNQGDPTLQDFTLDICKGQTVAVVGPTGSGKSTLANLLARFYDPQQGSISMDGTDLKNISNASLRSIIGIVAQDNFLFNESIAFNIGYGRPGASREEIIEAAKLANAHEFIMDDPLGYDRPCGERGCLLSGGQKQRIAIARAILKNPPVLILDEATSALDTVTEQAVQQAIGRLMASRTVLAIAHRLSTIVNADKIVVIDNGRIVEQGTHQELYKMNGRYRQLYDLQKPV